MTMSETSRMKEAQDNMRPGKVSLPGFLGQERDLQRLLDEDDGVVRRLGLTHAAIADRMRELRDAGTAGLGEFAAVSPHFEVRVDSVRGRLPCPFGDRGLQPKTNITVRNLSTGREITYTDMHIHLVAVHGFYEGRGNVYRIEPADLAAILEVKPAADKGGAP